MDGWIKHGEGSYSSSVAELKSYKNDYYDHSFFKTDRWRSILSDANLSETVKGYLSFRLDTEINYGYEEIQKLFELIFPFVVGAKQMQFIGHWQPEDGDRNYVFIFRDLEDKSNKILKEFNSKELGVLYDKLKGKKILNLNENRTNS